MALWLTVAFKISVSYPVLFSVLKH